MNYGLPVTTFINQRFPKSRVDFKSLCGRLTYVLEMKFRSFSLPLAISP